MTSVIRTNIGSALLSLRKSKTLSMREAAEELKISQSAYSQYERGSSIYLTGIFFMYLKSMIVCLKITRMPSPVFFMPQISVIRMNPEKTTTKKTAVRSVL